MCRKGLNHLKISIAILFSINCGKSQLKMTMKKTTEIDILILSYAQTKELRNVTSQSVQSLIDSEHPQEIKFNIHVLESEKSIKPFQYEYTKTIYPEEDFNFHRYLNIGINITSSPYICLCNNDLLFQKGWASEILNAFGQFDYVYSASPICPYYPAEIGIAPVREIWFGHRAAVEIRGACLFFKRDMLKLIGQLDPNFKFYHADDDYAHTLRVLGIKHILVKSSIVFHLGSKTLKKQNSEVKLNLTDEQDIYYGKKWAHRLGLKWIELS